MSLLQAGIILHIVTGQRPNEWDGLGKPADAPNVSHRKAMVRYGTRGRILTTRQAG
jgi:hypothetical protein